MTKEQLIALGAPEALAEKIAGESAKELNRYIEKTKFSELEVAKKQADETLKERDKQLEELKKSSGNNTELKNQIEKLQADNENMKQAHAKELTEIKINSAIDMALTNAKVKNLKAVKALLNQENIKLKDDGTLDGVDVQIEGLKKSDAYLFESVENQSQRRGFVPAPNPNSNEGNKPTTLSDAVKSFFNK